MRRRSHPRLLGRKRGTPVGERAVNRLLEVMGQLKPGSRQITKDLHRKRQRICNTVIMVEVGSLSKSRDLQEWQRKEG